MNVEALAKIARDQYLKTEQRGVLYVRNRNNKTSLSYGLRRDYDLLLYSMVETYNPTRQAVIDLHGHYLTVDVL